LNFFKLGSH